MRAPAMFWLGVATAVTWCGVIGAADQAAEGAPRKSRGPAGATLPPGTRPPVPRQPAQGKSAGADGKPAPGRPTPSRGPASQSSATEKNQRNASGREPDARPVGTPAQPARPVAAISPEQTEFFEKKIRPVLVQHCLKCHSGNPAEAKGGLLLDSAKGLLAGGESGPALVTENPDEGTLIAALRYDGLRMPPSAQLPEAVIDDFVRWVKDGAPYPDRKGTPVVSSDRLWSLEPVRSFTPPAVQDAEWPKTLSDNFLLAGLEAQGLTPAPAADRETLLRRVTFDLTGLPPSPGEIDSFLADDSADAYERVVDRLLASPRFGETWGRHWLDVARFSESSGKTYNFPLFHAWRYRNWVVEAFNADLPYDRFVIEQLAGDLLPASNAAERNRQRIATGFLALGPKNLAEGKAEQYLMDVVDDQIEVATTTLLGLTVTCARCHDHKFDPIKTADYYRFAGIFRSTLTLAGVFPGGHTDAIHPNYFELLEDESGPGHAETTDVESRSRDLLREMQPVFDRLQELASLDAQKERARSGVEKQLRAELRESLEQRQSQLVEIWTGKSGARNFRGLPFGKLPLLTGVRDRVRPVDSHVLVGGDLKNVGERVSRGMPDWFPDVPQPSVSAGSSGRLELAHWIAHPRNPLTPRVLVNRVWLHLFGQGIVDTPDNFGMVGSPPSHPELLDALADQFVRDGWSVKRLIRTLVTSRAYQMSGQYDARSFAVDSGNRLVWHIPPRRLTAESIRDTLLFIAGQLEVSPSPRSVVDDLPPLKIFGPRIISEFKKPQPIRSVYLPSARGIPSEFMELFDQADASLIVGDRRPATVAPQFLLLLNSPQVIAAADGLSRRILRESSQSRDRQIIDAYRIVFGRSPTEPELRESQRFFDDLAQQPVLTPTRRQGGDLALSCFCQALFMSAEFQTIY